MACRKTSIANSENAHRARQRVVAIEQLLFTRRMTARALGDISIATVQRLENAGKLTKVRLAGSENGVVFHRAEQVRKLAAGKTSPTKSVRNSAPSRARLVTETAS